ncbi:MAG: hypothetical protein GXY07_12765 [Candidatus Hydrogenedentes bacterium]|nr:hypothetical protein [Candidatus Hydrogenedentota bacterium]
MRLRQARHCRKMEFTCDPHVLAKAAFARSPWHETGEEIADALEASTEKALLLRWVRREMRRRLSPRECRYLEEHYFCALPVATVARRNGVHRMSVYRGLRRAIGKLQRAARENGRDTPEDEAVLRAIKNRTR